MPSLIVSVSVAVSAAMLAASMGMTMVGIIVAYTCAGMTSLLGCAANYLLQPEHTTERRH